MTTFEEIIIACSMPNEYTVRNALESRNILQENEADLITYLSGFTHFAESKQFIEDYKLKLLSHPRRVVDTSCKDIHLKLFVIDMTLLANFQIQDLADILGAEIFRNYVYPRQQGGEYIATYRQNFHDESLLEYNNYIDSLTPIQDEEVITVVRQCANGVRILLHIASVTRKNQLMNCSRLFCNVSYIVLFSGTDWACNISLPRLSQLDELYPTLREAYWLVIGESGSEANISYLNNTGAHYVFFPYNQNEIVNFTDILLNIVNFCINKL